MVFLMPETQQIQAFQASAVWILSILDGAPRVSLLPAGFEPTPFSRCFRGQIVKFAHPFWPKVFKSDDPREP
jgi:hypothetical protein